MQCVEPAEGDAERYEIASLFPPDRGRGDCVLADAESRLDRLRERLHSSGTPIRPHFAAIF